MEQSPSHRVADEKPDHQTETQHTETDEERSHRGFLSLLTVEAGEVYKPQLEQHSRWYQRLLNAGIEENGIKPVPVEERTNTQYSDFFTVFFTCCLCLLPYVVTPIHLWIR